VRGRGYIGSDTNQGYGNTVLIRNADTGEKIRTSHLSQINVQPGQKVKTGEVLGLSGATGNVTGPHTDVEYRNKLGVLADILNTAYGKQLF
jgi:murein DD-endopeptidase MepM/ murein hydrolase activator NlpD